MQTGHIRAGNPRRIYCPIVQILANDRLHFAAQQNNRIFFIFIYLFSVNSEFGI